MANSDNYDFSGVWRSTHHKAIGKNVPKTDHYVTLRLIGNQLIVESIPSANGSYLFARFTLESNVATGTYQSENSPHTRTKGAVYYGAAQLILSKDGKKLEGMGVGFDQDMKVEPTVWNLTHVGQSRPEAA
jgi:hypothetical protein